MKSPTPSRGRQRKAQDSPRRPQETQTAPAKALWKPGTMVYPVPALLVTCGSLADNDYNLFTAAWTGTVCTNPPMTYVSIRPERHSYEMVKARMEFVLNLTTVEMARATDWCGVRSGRDYDKFAETGLTPMPSTYVAAPSVAESPLSIECRVREIIPLGSHDMFLAEVIGVMADERYLDAQGKWHLEASDPLVYLHGGYYELGKLIGRFGFSVKKS